MTNCEPIADLYTCWHCQEHAVEIKVGAEPPEYHDVCGYGPLQWSGQLFDRIHGARTYELRAARVEPKRRSRRTELKTREFIPFDLIDPNPFQPRREYDLSVLLDLADSIYRLDVLQAPLGRRTSSGRVQVAFGHQRTISCWMLHENGLYRPGMDMDVADLTDDEMAIIALTENEVRKQLSQIEVVRAYRRAIDETGLSVADLADRLGVARPTLANNLRVLELPDFVLQHVESGDLGISVAREFLALQNDDHAHTEDMQAIINRITDNYDVRHRGVLPNWTRRNVRNEISDRVAQNEQDFRPLGNRVPGVGHFQAGAVRETTFDVEAFSKEFRKTLHTIPVGDSSREWTCEVKAWRAWQTRATREANKEKGDSGTLGGSARSSAGESRDKQFERVLAGDPVWKEVAAARDKKGPNRPNTAEEREQLGSRAELKDVSYSTPFWKIVDIANPDNPRGWRDDRGGRMPPWFPDLEECRNCTIGAAYAKSRDGYTLSKTTLACFNKEHYLEKAAAGEKVYREKLEAHKLGMQRQDSKAARLLIQAIGSMSDDACRVLAHSLLAARQNLAWQHPFEHYDEHWSYEGGALTKAREILGVEDLNDSWQVQRYGTVLDVAKLDGLDPADVRELVANLMAHHLRESGRIEAVSQETLALIPVPDAAAQPGPALTATV